MQLTLTLTLAATMERSVMDDISIKAPWPEGREQSQDDAPYTVHMASSQQLCLAEAESRKHQS